MTNARYTDESPESRRPARFRVALALGVYYPEIHRGVVRFASEHDWCLTAELDDPVPEDWHGDGVLALLSGQMPFRDRLFRLDVPIVDVAESHPDIRVPRVTTDNIRIGQMAAEYFVDRGYQHFVFVHEREHGVSLRRREGFQTGLAVHGFSPELLSWESESAGRANSRQCRHDWLKERLIGLPRPLAVFATRDREAAEVADACLDAGLAVPHEVSILGAGNTETLCDVLQVGLSSVNVELDRLGYEAARLLHDLMRGASAPEQPVYLPPSGIVERHSTNSLAVEHPGVAAAIRFIQEHFTDPIGMMDIVKHVQMSRSGLEKAFREHFTRPPMEHLRYVRLQRARDLLRQTDDKIGSVAVQSGFPTAHQLCRVFRSQLGLTPGEYRLRIRNGSVHAAALDVSTSSPR